MDKFMQRYGPWISGVLSGFDRMRFRGTLRRLARPQGIMGLLRGLGVPFKHFGRFAQETTAQIDQATQDVARRAGRPLQYVAKPSANKEQIALEIARRDGVKQGLVCVLSCTESCWSFGVRGGGEIVRCPRRCLHYYHYFLDPDWGLMHVRLQSWLPLGIHVCVNAREWLARQMERQGLGCVQADNCFTRLDDPAKAQELMDGLLKTDWVEFLSPLARGVNPLHDQILAPYPPAYYWTLEQSEWATDLMFKDAGALNQLYRPLVRHAMLSLGGNDVLKFLGRQVTSAGQPHHWFAGQVSSNLRQWTEGLRVKHAINLNSIKMYDKQGSVLRVETTINNPREMKVYRPKEGDDQGPKDWRYLRKGVADIWRRAQVCQAANRRYIQALASVTQPGALGDLLGPLCQPIRWAAKPTARPTPVRGLRPMAKDDAALLEAVGRGQFTINGLRNRDVREILWGPAGSDKTQERRRSGQVTRRLRMLRAHGLIQKIPKTHRYKVSPAGRVAITALLTARSADTAKLAMVA